MNKILGIVGMVMASLGIIFLLPLVFDPIKPYDAVNGLLGICQYLFFGFICYLLKNE